MDYATERWEMVVGRQQRNQERSEHCPHGITLLTSVLSQVQPRGTDASQ